MAADGWQEEYSTCLIKLWFRQGIASPDLFTEMTSRQQLHVKIWIGLKALSAKMHEDWFESFISKDAREGRALNRIISWTDAGAEYKADPR